MYTIYNCHTHIYTKKNIAMPFSFLSRGLLNILFILKRFEKERKRIPFLSLFIEILPLPFKKAIQIIDQSSKIIDVTELDKKIERDLYKYPLGKSLNQQWNLKVLMSYYPKNSKFCLLSMDMEYMKAGRLKQPFLEQLDELSNLKKIYPDDILPFIFVDPRRHNIYQLVKKYIEYYHFQGIKIYPSLGYRPYDHRLYNIYKYAEENRIPIIAHCSKEGFYYKGKHPEILSVVGHEIKTKRMHKKLSKKEIAISMNDPVNYYHVLKDFPKLKICLAHFGGIAKWQHFLHRYSTIVTLMKNYDNVYADISIPLQRPEHYALIKFAMEDKILRERILFGTDFYFHRYTYEGAFWQGLSAHLGEENFKQIANLNPWKFLSHEY